MFISDIKLHQTMTSNDRSTAICAIDPSSSMGLLTAAVGA